MGGRKGREPSKDALGGIWALRRQTPARITAESGPTFKETLSNDTIELSE